MEAQCNELNERERGGWCVWAIKEKGRESKKGKGKRQKAKGRWQREDENEEVRNNLGVRHESNYDIEVIRCLAKTNGCAAGLPGLAGKNSGVWGIVGL